MSFPDLAPTLQQALSKRDYASATDVQAAVLAPEAEGRDLLVSAQTGSGKTVAFGLALAAQLLDVFQQEHFRAPFGENTLYLEEHRATCVKKAALETCVRKRLARETAKQYVMGPD